MSFCTSIKIENKKHTGKSFSMCSEHRTLTWTLLLLLLSGALCYEWDVKYQPVICAVKGSSVVIPCSFHYPPHLAVQNVMWGHERNNFYTGPFLFENNNMKSSKFEYVGDKHHNCSLKIHSVEHNDQGKYAFRFTTNTEKGIWTGSKGSQLNIIDLKIKRSNGNRTTNEGDSVELTCLSSCSGLNRPSAFLWLKNGELITEEPSLRLSNVSSSSSGNYSCSLKSHKETTSGVININVEYGPKNTTTSAGPSMEVDLWSSIIVTCSSDANPPVENYTWFKIHYDDIESVGHKSELYIIGVSNDDNGQYFCRATNKHGSQNSSVTLKVKGYFSHSISISISIAAAAAVTALLIALAVVTVFRKLNKEGTSAPEVECVEDMQDAVYTNWPVFDNSQSQPGNKYKAKTTEEPFYATVAFSKKTESNMQQQTATCNEDESVIYSTVWREQTLNKP
ncbi:B-cell receptor CD22-like [Solea senegalensis]|nr:B-cell receptor CD22-like [Solea senegalensis]